MELAALNGLSDGFSDPDLAEVSGTERASASQMFDKVKDLALVRCHVVGTKFNAFGFDLAPFSAI